ncbi:PAS domain S-box protein [Marinifilum sp.]|uniref:PAS domain-containing hybrid sensor histidine kinase/response regulator n=1 Tax=Marinifilum sp. TaxID=2033137 RepID=UPI003BA9C583
MNQEHQKSITELLTEIARLKNQINSINRDNDFFGRYHNILSNEKIVAFDWNFNDNQIVWSDDAEKVFNLKENQLGYSRESFLQCIHPEDTPYFIDKLSMCFCNQSTNYESTFRLAKNSESETWIKISCQILYNEKGEPLNTIGILKDITPLKRTEEAQHLNDLRYQTLFNYSPVPLWEEEFSELYQYLNHLKSEGVDNFEKYFTDHPQALALCSQKVKITDVNIATLKLHNADSKEELLGNLDKVFTQKSYEVFKDEVVSLANGRKEFETEGEIKTINGVAKHIHLKLLVDYNSKDRAKAILATIDITDRKKADIALAESEKKFRTSFESSDVGMAIVGSDKKFLSVNIAFSRMIGLDINELKNKTFLNITHPDDLNISKQKYSQSLNDKHPFTIEKRYLNNTRKVRWGLTTISPIFNSYGEHINSILHVQDITERKIAEENLIKSSNEYEALAEEYKTQNEELIEAIAIAERSDRLKSEFLQNLSHEIRTPMNAILGFTEFLELESISSEKRNQYIGIIKNSGFQLLRIIDDILEISALETKHVQLIEDDFNLNNLLTELFTIFQPQSKKQKLALYLHKDLNDDCCEIRSDELKLKKILINLIENALKFTNSGSIEIGYYSNKSNLELYVKDTGIGIEPERHTHIFERFSQAEGDISKKLGGLGLGLSIVKENVKLLKGNIRLISELGKGSMFIISLPNCLISTHIRSTEEEKDKKQYNILIAEDEEINYFYFKSLMEKIAPHCKLEHAKNGTEALEMCKEKDFDIVFMDIKMPEMNGYEATAKIKKIKPNQNIVAQTAYSTNEDKIKARVAGCNEFLSKPLSLKNVQNLLDKYLFK